MKILAGRTTPLLVMLCSGGAAVAAPIVGPAVALDAPVDASNGGMQFAEAVSFDGVNYLVVWSEGRHLAGAGKIYGARVDKSGVALDPPGFKVADAEIGFADVAFGGGEHLACWIKDMQNGNYVPNTI